MIAEPAMSKDLCGLPAPAPAESSRPESSRLHELVSHPQMGVKAVTKRDIRAGEVLFKESGPLMPRPTMWSVQVDVDLHCDIQGEGRFASHSFSPNCYLRFGDAIEFVALRDIARGADITFDYTTTEWEIACVFDDLETGRPTRGFKYLDDAAKFRLLHSNLLPRHILQLWIQHGQDGTTRESLSDDASTLNEACSLLLRPSDEILRPSE